MTRRTFTPEQRAIAVELYRVHGARKAAGMCHEQGIVCTPQAIHKWANAAGVKTESVDNTGNQVRGARLSAEARKLALADDLLDDAQRLRRQLFAPARVHSFGGVEHEVHFADLAQPTFADQTKIMTSVAIAVDKIQLLTGQATSREEHTVTDRRALEAQAAELDELAARRAQQRQAQ